MKLCLSKPFKISKYTIELELKYTKIKYEC